jgi:hypothetical protein
LVPEAPRNSCQIIRPVVQSVKVGWHKNRHSSWLRSKV